MEGPSLIILKEELQPFVGKKIQQASGLSKIDYSKVTGSRIREFRSWGKHFLIVLDEVTLRIHFLMFGSYRINERKETPARLSLVFNNGEINFYGCSVNFIEGDLDELYDWPADVMSDVWDPEAARLKLINHPNMMVCDALLNQDIFAGSGNIIKNEVLYRIRVHPETLIENLPEDKLEELIVETRNYSFDFLRWKKQFELKKNWLAHTRRKCLRCDLPFSKMHLGKTNRRSFFCNNCQVKY
mgnify:CR=1 FL=1